MSKKIEFDEYTYVLHRYPVEVEVSNEDFELIKKGTLALNKIVYKYDVEYGCDEVIYDDFIFDSFDNLEEIS